MVEVRAVHGAENREWIDFAKGTAIALVVLYHAGLFLSEFDLADGTSGGRALLQFFPMPMFFFIAGLTGGRMLSWSFPELWRRRLLPLAYLYILWSGIRVLFYLVVPHLRGSEGSPTRPLNILLLPVWPTSSYWFIWALAIFILIAWLLRDVPPPVQLIGAALLAVAATTPGWLDTDNVGWDRVAQNLIFYLAALFIPHTVYRLAARVRVWHAALLLVAYFSIALTILLVGGSRIPGLVLVTSAVAVALGVAASTVLVRWRWLGFVSVLGQRSLQIYLVHLFVIAAAIALVAPFADVGLLRQFSSVLMFVLGAIALVASLYLPRLLRRFTWLWVSPFGRRRIRKRKTAASSSGAS